MPTTPGSDRLTVDAGLFVPGSIHGYTFEDLNGDGIRDWLNDPTLPGISLELAGDEIAPREATTDPNGEYGFTGLVPGTPI